MDVSDPGSLGATTRTEAVLKAMLTRMGGLERFADQWYDFLRIAAKDGKHHIIQRSFEAILRLMELTDRASGDRDAEHPIDRMSEEELRERMSKSVVRMMWVEPSLAVVVLEALGWKLEPPDEPPARELIEPVAAQVRESLPSLFGPAPVEA